MGISRLTDITRLDRLGVPVYASVRPRGRTLRVHAGKGTRPEEAAAGALMEAIEFEVAERDSAAGAEYRLPWGELVDGWPGGLGPADFSLRLGRTPRLGAAVDTARCRDLVTGRVVLLPTELVFMPGYARPEPSLYGSSTNGLASGNSLEEATLHALLEVLERDAVAMNRARDASQIVDMASLPVPFAALAPAWKRQGVELIVRHVPNDFDLPCFEAHLHEAASTDVNLAGGYGLHPDRGVALARAVTEAAQSRLSLIHGGRDDIKGFFGKYAQPDQAARLIQEGRLLARLSDATRPIAFDQLPQGPSCTSARVVLRDLIEHLQACGFRQVFRRRLRRGSERLQGLGLHVVKVVVPRCEHLSGAEARLGPRLLGRVLNRA